MGPCALSRAPTAVLKARLHSFARPVRGENGVMKGLSNKSAAFSDFPHPMNGPRANMR